MSPRAAVPLALLCLATGACSLPSHDAVRAEFQAEHPTAVIAELYVGEGDSDHALFTIRYRDTTDNRDYRACWLYSDYQTGEWRVMRKHRVPEPAPERYCR